MNIPDSAIADYERIQAMPEPSVPFCFYSQTGHDWVCDRCKCGATRCEKAECVEESCGGEFGMCLIHTMQEWQECVLQDLKDLAAEENDADRQKTMAVLLGDVAEVLGCAKKAEDQHRRFEIGQRRAV